MHLVMAIGASCPEPAEFGTETTAVAVACASIDWIPMIRPRVISTGPEFCPAVRTIATRTAGKSFGVGVLPVSVSKVRAEKSQ